MGVEKRYIAVYERDVMAPNEKLANVKAGNFALYTGGGLRLMSVDLDTTQPDEPKEKELGDGKCLDGHKQPESE
jgi:hypothetical protein